MVKPLIATVWLGVMWKMRKMNSGTGSLATVSKSEPGPLIVMFLSITSSTLVRLIV